METLVKTHNTEPEKIVALSRSWKCCGGNKKCGEEMHRCENNCNWCTHVRCSKCKKLEV